VLAELSARRAASHALLLVDLLTRVSELNIRQNTAVSDI